MRNDLPLFQRHVKIKHIQSHSFEQDKSNDNNRILQIDFAMAYSCDYQNEIQSALCSRETVQLFTAALFFKKNALLISFIPLLKIKVKILSMYF